MDSKYLIGIVVLIIAIIAVGAYALQGTSHDVTPVVNNTTDKVVNHTVNDTVNKTVNTKEVQKETQSSSSTVYYASVKTDKFHKPSCEWAQKISSKNLVTYNSRDEAIAAGKSPCEVCNP